MPVALAAPCALFDLMENSLVADMVSGRIPVTEPAAGLASAYTLLKWAFLLFALIALGIFRLAAARRPAM